LTCFEHPGVHCQEDTYVQFYGISFLHTYEQSGKCQDVLDQTHPDIDQTAYMYAGKKYHKTACTSLPDNEHLDVRNMSKAL